MLIEAISLIYPQFPYIQLTIYGEGPLQRELQGLIEQKKLSENIILYGRTNDMMSELKKNDLFVMSSNYEGMPNALLEAMALGMPCISTDCRTGPSEMIDNYNSGILVSVNDAKEMAEAIKFMVEQSEQAHNMGNKAREFVVKNCTVDVITEKFICECEKFRKKVL
jgi:glycosyltransferase involved in cell wall biosynthesis